jgi:hypothetical protein
VQRAERVLKKHGAPAPAKAPAKVEAVVAEPPKAPEPTVFEAAERVLKEAYERSPRAARLQVIADQRAQIAAQAKALEPAARAILGRKFLASAMTSLGYAAADRHLRWDHYSTYDLSLLDDEGRRPRVVLARNTGNRAALHLLPYGYNQDLALVLVTAHGKEHLVDLDDRRTDGSVRLTDVLGELPGLTPEMLEVSIARWTENARGRLSRLE